MDQYQCGNCRTLCYPLMLPEGWKCMACSLTTPSTMWLKAEYPEPLKLDIPACAPPVIPEQATPPPVVQPAVPPPPPTNKWQLAEDPFAAGEEEPAPQLCFVKNTPERTAALDATLPPPAPPLKTIVDTKTGERIKPEDGLLEAPMKAAFKTVRDRCRARVEERQAAREAAGKPRVGRPRGKGKKKVKR